MDKSKSTETDGEMTGSEEQQKRFELEQLAEKRLMLNHEINGINVVIQFGFRKRTQRERDIDQVDLESVQIKRALGVPRREWLFNERRAAEYSFMKQYTWFPHNDVERCPATSSARCGLTLDHPHDYGHVGFELVEYDDQWEMPTSRVVWPCEEDPQKG